MRLRVIFVAVLVLASTVPINCQMSGVKLNLMPCYNVSALPGITIADNRPPATLNIFLEVIRRLEDANPTKSAKELATLILQRLRQDGIISTGRSTDIRWALPFSPSNYESVKQTIFTEKFITNSSLELLYGDLDPVEICSFHYMISSTTNITKRGDEASTCSRSARYTSRMRRDVQKSEFAAEVMEDFQPRAFVADSEKSQCPIENGVVYTNYGTVKVGQVLNGIATGFAQQNYGECDNRYATTVSGEIVEAAFVQGTENIKIGAPGGWNSTINPKYYFLQKKDKLDVTDAEIRGSIDGLYMALKMDKWKSTFSDLKISQIIDLYYSPQQKGVFDPSFKACNRNIFFSEMASTDKLRTETLNLMAPLSGAGYRITVKPDFYPDLANASLQAFLNYIPQLSSDLTCIPKGNIERVATDLFIFIDASWNYNIIKSVLSYVLDNIDVNKFGTRYTVFGAFDGINITSNSTRYLLDFQKQYNLTIHQTIRPNFDYSKVYEVMESIAKSKLNNKTYSGGESTIALLIPRTIPDAGQRIFLEQRKEIIKRYMPDLTVLVLGAGTQGDYSSVVFNPKDFNLMTETTNENDLKRLGQSIVDRIKNVPRSIVNPSCGSKFNGPTTTFTSTDYVELNGVNYYKISPNYFYAGEGTRNLRISELSYGSIDVCISRDQIRPSFQTSECQTLKSSVLTKDISGYCDGTTLSACSPIYISISGNTTQYKCRDNLCRFPENIKYSISLENVGCASGSVRVVANLALVFSFFLFMRF
nr:uncharacterized protein LOC111517975 [Leptinotarsa decemlineata]